MLSQERWLQVVMKESGLYTSCANQAGSGEWAKKAVQGAEVAAESRNRRVALTLATSTVRAHGEGRRSKLAKIKHGATQLARRMAALFLAYTCFCLPLSLPAPSSGRV